jgi:hypothetical protein
MRYQSNKSNSSNQINHMKNIVILFLLISLSSCSLYNTIDCYDGKIITKTITTSDFHKLDIDFSSNVVLKEGNKLEITVEGKEDLIADLEKLSKVENDTWKARIKNGCFDLHRNETKLIITIPNLTAIVADGNVSIVSEMPLSNITTMLTCAIDGNADVNLELLNETSITLTIDGNADVILKGKGQKMEVNIDGNADLEAHDFTVDQCSVLVDGNASAQVNVNTKLIVNIDGVGRVCYKGHPQIESKINGVGSVKNCN